MRHLNLKAVLAGTVLGLLIDVLTGLLLTTLLAPAELRPGMPAEEMRRVVAEVTRGTPFLLAGLVLGTLSTVVAAYVSARMARRLPYMHAAAVGVLGLLLGLLLGDDTLPLWFDALGQLSILPAALVGGHLAKRRMGGAPPAP